MLNREQSEIIAQDARDNPDYHDVTIHQSAGGGYFVRACKVLNGQRVGRMWASYNEREFRPRPGRNAVRREQENAGRRSV